MGAMKNKSHKGRERSAAKSKKKEAGKRSMMDRARDALPPVPPPALKPDPVLPGFPDDIPGPILPGTANDPRATYGSGGGGVQIRFPARELEELRELTRSKPTDGPAAVVRAALTLLRFHVGRR